MAPVHARAEGVPGDWGRIAGQEWRHLHGSLPGLAEIVSLTGETINLSNKLLKQRELVEQR